MIYSRILDCTHKLIVGPMVTNPATRDWTVTASLFATLNEMYGNRTICGIGRGDSAVRAINGKPVKLAELRECIEVIRALANGGAVGIQGHDAAVPVEPRQPAADLGRRLRPERAEARGRGRRRVHPPAGRPRDRGVEHPDGARGRRAAGRDPEALTMCVAAPAYVTDGTDAGRAHALDQCRWFGGMVGNHVADIVSRYGGEGAAVPKALTDYIAGRQGYDYNEHGRAGNTHTEFVPDEIVERFCLIGPPETQVARLKELAELGVGHFGLYLQHDAQAQTMSAFGERVIPAVNAPALARG